MIKIIFSVLLFCTLANAKPKIYTTLPPNDLYIPVTRESESVQIGTNPAKSKAGLTHAEFDAVLDRVQKIYAPVIAQRGGQFNIVRSWTNGEVNSQAWKEGSVWNIEMFGGIARYRKMSMDGFALVACHETGHLLGGAPLYPGDDMAAEGQADYFSTAKCMKLYSAMDNSDVIMKNIAIDADASKSCSKYSKEIAICKRASQAGQILSDLLADLEGSGHPHFGTPDKNVVSTTDVDHPAAQCRLDTYFHGALCNADAASSSSQTDYKVGYCTDRVYNSRARCWFAP